MKHKGLIGIGLIIFSLIFSACEKYEGEISGKVTYIDITDSKEYPAAYAILDKCRMEGDSMKIVSSVKADSKGAFLFDYVAKGDWIIAGRLSFEDTVYEAVSEKITISEKSKKEIQMALKHKENTETK